MTNMDNQLAKHIKAMLSRAMQKPPERHEGALQSDTLKEVVRTLRTGPCYPYDPRGLTRASGQDESPKTK